MKKEAIMHIEEYSIPGAGSRSVPLRFVRSCYLPLKLIYCMLGIDRLMGLVHPRVFHSDFRTLDTYYDMMHERMLRYGCLTEHPVVLELGPGNSYIIPYNFIHHGARRVYLVDKYPRQNDSAAQKRYFLEESAHFLRKYGLECVDYIDMNEYRPCDGRISYIEGDILALNIPDPVDYVFSVAVLQHVPDLELMLKKLYSMMRRGALMYHIVDMKDKWYEYGASFSFYRYSDRLWDRYLTNTSNFVNRLRFGEYIELFDRCGFEMMHYTSWEYPMDERRLAPRFKDRDDLAVGMAHFFLRKP